MSLKDEMKNGAEQYGAGSQSDFFRFDKSGVYKIRILTKPIAIATHFFGKGVPSAVCYGKKEGCPHHKGDKPTVKFVSYLINRTTGMVQLGELPWSVISVVAELEQDEDFKFENYPMPYDIKVTVDKENNDPKQIYKTLGSPKATPVTTEEDNQFQEKMSKLNPEEFVLKRKEKQLEKDKQSGTWISPEQMDQEKQATVVDPETIEYPADDLPDPKDIPF